MPALDTSAFAAEVAAAHAGGATIDNRPSARDENFDLAGAYAVVHELARLKREEGHGTVGRKIGLTNTTVWPKLGLENIVWGYVFEDTVHYAANNSFTMSLAGTVAPKIEPEIVFKLKTSLSSEDTNVESVLEAVEWIALGFEIVDCPYPGWRFRPADMVAAYGFHRALVIGEPHLLDSKNLLELAEQIGAVKSRLFKNGELAVEGSGSNVFGSPVRCLGQLSRTIPGDDLLRAGEVVTSGTLSDAPLITAGEEWRAELEGLALSSLGIKFTE